MIQSGQNGRTFKAFVDLATIEKHSRNEDEHINFRVWFIEPVVIWSAGKTGGRGRKRCGP
jgi:hypothetical protein